MPSSNFNLILPPRYPPLEPPLQNNLHPQIQTPNACPVYYLITVFKDLCFGRLYLKRLVIFCLHSSLSISVFLLPMLCQLFHFAGSFVSKVYSTVHSGQLCQKSGDKSNILFFIISGKNPLKYDHIQD